MKTKEVTQKVVDSYYAVSDNLRVLCDELGIEEKFVDKLMEQINKKVLSNNSIDLKSL